MGRHIQNEAALRKEYGLSVKEAHEAYEDAGRDLDTARTALGSPDNPKYAAGKARMREVEAEAKEGMLRRELATYATKQEYVAQQLWKLVGATNVEFENLPKKNPLTSATDFEWKQALELVERKREARAAGIVDKLCHKSDARRLKRDLGYILCNNHYAKVAHLDHYVAQLRTAQGNFAALADALESELMRLEATRKGVAAS